MGQFYQSLDRAGDFDYELHEMPVVQANQAFRGPPISLDRPYVAFVGAAQTFGRFVQRPFPVLIVERLGLQSLNLGVGGAGPRHFNRDPYVRLLNGAELVVFQVLSGRSASNSRFDNRPIGAMRGHIPGQTDRINADEFFSKVAETQSFETFLQLIDETRRDYMAEFRDLLSKVSVPKILLWLSKRSPDYHEDHSQLPFGIFGEFPQLVNSRMIGELRLMCDAYVEVVSRIGLPQELWKSGISVKGAKLVNGRLQNTYYPSPEMHELAAEKLHPVCRRFVGSNVARQAADTFVVIGPERSGTNLLVDLLNQHVGCYCGNEIFNSSAIENGRLPWRGVPESDLQVLLDLRVGAPVEFWRSLRKLAAAAGFGTIGFKLLYRQAFAQNEILAHLSSDRTAHVIHVTRRNLLRRFVSERQARATRKWSTSLEDPFEPSPEVVIRLDEAIKSFTDVEAETTRINEVFGRHHLLEIVYEDLAANPARVVSRAARFLGVQPAANLQVRTRKVGVERLGDAVVNIEELRGRMRRWSAFFDDEL